MANEIPAPVAPIASYLTVDDSAAAIAFYESVFGAKCTHKLHAEDGKRLMHATIMIGELSFMLSDEFPEFGGYHAPDKERGSPVAVSLRYPNSADVDTIYKRALENGGTSSHPPEDMFWNDRFCQFHDPCGHRWMVVAALKSAT